MQTPIVNIIAGLYDGYAHESITVADTAIGFTAATCLGKAEVTLNTDRAAARAIVTVETAQLRYTYDGTTPTASVGHILNIGDVLVIQGRGNMSRFLAIRTGASSATLKVTYER